MNSLRELSPTRIAIGLILIIVVGGLALTFFSSAKGAVAEPLGLRLSAGGAAVAGLNSEYGGSFAPSDQSQVISVVTASSTTTMIATATSTFGNPQTAASAPLNTSAGGSQGSGSIEYFSNVTMVSSSPPKTTSTIVTVAYDEGGYVAYSSSNANYSFVVLRVPAAEFQTVLAQIQSLGNVTNTVRWSNDVTVQYTDLNATLASLQTEDAALLKILNSSTSVNDTLKIESQIQSVDQQIDETESQILETQRLIDYSTISVTITISSQSIKPSPLALKLSATPRSGLSPLGVTFSAIVQGGVAPYTVNYNFGDGTSQQGQIVIHDYDSAGSYNATVTVTDSAGNVAMASAVVNVKSPSAASPLAGFAGNVENLFVDVIEDMAEVAVVVVPVGLVLLAIIMPLRRRPRIQREVKPS